MKKIVVLRLGHRINRDQRMTTHVALTARALGADGMLLVSSDKSIEQKISDVTKRWGGSFYVRSDVKWRGEIKKWKEEGIIDVTGVDGETRKLNYSFYEEAEKVKAYESAAKIKIPALIVHGDEDETVPIEQSKRTANLIENCRLEIIEGGDHTYSDSEHFEKMLNLISEFIIERSQDK